MTQFGKTSKARLMTCHALLQELFMRVVERRDCSVTCGHRSNEQQDALYAQGRTEPGQIVTNAKAGQSKHNTSPSVAIDVVPWPEQWGSEEAFLDLSKVVQDVWTEMEAEGVTMGLKLRWGGDWDGDGDRADQKFNDFPHWELV